MPEGLPNAPGRKSSSSLLVPAGAGRAPRSQPRRCRGEGRRCGGGRRGGRAGGGKPAVPARLPTPPGGRAAAGRSAATAPALRSDSSELRAPSSDSAHSARSPVLRGGSGSSAGPGNAGREGTEQPVPLGGAPVPPGAEVWGWEREVVGLGGRASAGQSENLGAAFLEDSTIRS